MASIDSVDATGNASLLVLGGSGPVASYHTDALHDLPETGLDGLADQAMPGYQTCAKCGKTGCTLACGRCNVRDVGNFRVFYCSTECQQADWPSHKPICRSREQLARAVSIITGVWETLEKKTFAKSASIRSAFDQGGGDNAQKKEFDSRCWSGESLIKEFSTVIFPSGTPGNVKLAFLYDQGCAEPLNTGFDIVRMFLQPISQRIEEVPVEVKGKSVIIELPGESNEDAHTVLRVTLTTGETFSIDLTGPQYGWREKLYIWETFRAHRVNCTEPGQPFGQCRKWENVVYSLQPPTGCPWVLREIRLGLVKDLKATLELNIRATAGSISKFLALKDAPFATTKQYIMQQTEQCLVRSIEDLAARNIGRCYFSNDFEVCATATERQGKQLQKVWFTREEVEKIGKVAILQKTWLQRLAKSGSDQSAAVQEA